MIDVSKLKSGVKVLIADGEVGVVRGSYMSTGGIVITVKTNPSSIVDRNVPLEDIKEIIE